MPVRALVRVRWKVTYILFFLGKGTAPDHPSELFRQTTSENTKNTRTFFIMELPKSLGREKQGALIKTRHSWRKERQSKANKEKNDSLSALTSTMRRWEASTQHVRSLHLLCSAFVPPAPRRLGDASSTKSLQSSTSKYHFHCVIFRQGCQAKEWY